MAEFICIKTNSVYSFGSRNPKPELCAYHYWLNDGNYPKLHLLRQMIENNEVCKNSINHVKNLIKKMETTK